MNYTKILSMAVLAVMAASCYDDYVQDYSVVGCGFANQVDVRSLIVGEGMKFSTGVALGGVIENKEDRFISYEIDYTLVNEDALKSMKSSTMSYISSNVSGVSALEALPASMYEIVTQTKKPGKVLIEKGTHLGKMDIKIDSVKFLSNVDRVKAYGVIPITLTSGNGTELIEGRETTVIGVRYENMLFGNWYHGGTTYVEDASGNPVDTVRYAKTIPQADSRVWTLTTVEPFALTANAVSSEFKGNNAQMKLTIDLATNKITVSSVAGAKFNVQPDGDSFFVKTKHLEDRMIVLNYKYEDGGNICHSHDTLTFRNRIRDGVNEWQD